ncbi:MAG: glycosyltransferase family 4 protein [Syntrophaceae bacterium]|nr:glycosyltransferase family 4 protein [Syntrophaceae bacterium]
MQKTIHYTIGYMIPEFPAQTHAFFWREIQALNKLGVSTELVSTKRPPNKLISHEWAEEAMRSTSYLFPLTMGGFGLCCRAFLSSNPINWFILLFAIIKTEEFWGKNALRIMGLALMGIELAGIAQKKRFRHVHVHSCADSATVALFAGKLSGLSYSMTLHGPRLADYGANQKNKWSHAAFGVAVSDMLMQELKECLGGFLPPILRKAPMGMDVNMSSRKKPYVPWSGVGVCRIFSCARLNKVKRHNDVIEAVFLLNQDGLPVELHIAGEDDSPDGEPRRQLENLIKTHGLESRVFLLGAISEKAVRKELEEAHLFVLASLNEGISVAAMEAMAMSVPVVVTNVGGMPELVRDGIDGAMVEPAQIQPLKLAIEKVIKSPNLASKLSVAGRKRVETQFHSGISAQVIYECIKESSI